MSKSALVFANGLYTPADLELARRLPFDLLIAVDGGYRVARQIARPHIFVGDVDSLPQDLAPELQNPDLDVHTFPPDKDATDLELALLLAVERGASRIHVFGALGGRWDHSLANLFLVLHPRLARRDIVFHHDGQRLFPVWDQVRLQAQPGDTVSLLPLTPQVHGVTLRGFRYPLENGTMQAGSTLGISNVVETLPAEIRVQRGVLLCIHIPQQVHQRIETAKTPLGGAR